MDLRGLDSFLPNRWVSTAMEYRQNNNPIRFSSKINTVRKTISNDAPYILMDNAVQVRIFSRNVLSQP
jgi:hypothetical protein